MRNTWVESANLNERMRREDKTLMQHYKSGDEEKLKNQIKNIATVAVEEFWRQEAFTDSDDYCTHMMHWKDSIQKYIPLQTYFKIKNNYKTGSLFKLVMKAILDDIEFYNFIYTDLFYDKLQIDGKPANLKCKCEICK